MPTIFNPLSFFRHVPNALLEQFFSSVPAFTGFDWRVVSEHRVESIYERCNLIPPDESARIFNIFRAVESLATPVGTQALIEASRDVDIDVAAEIAAKMNAHERALWCYIRDKRIFRTARMLGPHRHVAETVLGDAEEPAGESHRGHARNAGGTRASVLRFFLGHSEARRKMHRRTPAARGRCGLLLCLSGGLPRRTLRL